MTFYLGQKVTLKHECTWGDCEGLSVPVFGAVYTIRTAEEYSTGLYLRFAELRNHLRYGKNCEAQFLAKCFRPVVEPKADVSFTMGADPESEKFDNRRRVPACRLIDGPLVCRT